MSSAINRMVLELSGLLIVRLIVRCFAYTYRRSGVQKPEYLHAGTRVKILQPNYVAGKIGVILTQEELVGRQLTDRWIVQVESEDVLLSLTPREFHILQS